MGYFVNLPHWKFCVILYVNKVECDTALHFRNVMMSSVCESWPHTWPRCQSRHPTAPGPSPVSGPSRSLWCRGPPQTIPHSSRDWGPAWSRMTWDDGTGPPRTPLRERNVWEKQSTENISVWTVKENVWSEKLNQVISSSNSSQKPFYFSMKHIYVWKRILNSNQMEGEALKSSKNENSVIKISSKLFLYQFLYSDEHKKRNLEECL